MMLFIVVIRSVIDTDHGFDIVVADCQTSTRPYLRMLPSPRSSDGVCGVELK